MAGWKLTADNVGLRAAGLSCENLPVYAGPAELSSGTKISEKRITRALDLSAGDITIEKSCVQPTSVTRGMPVLTTTNNSDKSSAAGKVTIKDSEIDGSQLDHDSAAWATAFIGVADLTNNYVHDLGSGIALMNTGDTLSAHVEHNYVTNLLATGDPTTTGNHSSAFTIRDFDSTRNSDRKAAIVNNRFDCDSPNATGAFFIQAWSGRIDNLYVEGNLLEGDGYQLILERNQHSYSNMSAVNNRLTGTGFGAARVADGPGWAIWEDNHLYDRTMTGSRGEIITQPH